MNDFCLRPDALKTEEKIAVARVLDSGNYVLGAEVGAFEDRWAGVCGTRMAVGVANGMDAIEISLRALDIGRGDEVVTTAMTAFATVLAIMRAGATPVLADINPTTGIMDVQSVRRCVTSRTKAIVLVHLYGHVRDMEHWLALSNEYSIPLVEDCAQSHLARFEGQSCGSFGVAGAFSFYPTKNLGAAGDAGAVVTSDDVIAKQARVLRDYGQDGKYHHVSSGLNSRLDELQAALLLARMDWVEEFTERRKDIGAHYQRSLSHPEVGLLAAPAAPENHVYHLFVVLCARRDELCRHLSARGIQSAVHYPLPLHKQPACGGIRCDPSGVPNAERHANYCLSIPCHPDLDDADVESVASAINGFV